MLWRHLKTKVKLCIVERALRDFQLNWHNSWWWLRLLSFRTILAAPVWSRSKQRSRRQTCRLPRFSWRSKEELLITRALFAGSSPLLRYLHEYFILLLKLLCILEYYCLLLSNNEIHWPCDWIGTIISLVLKICFAPARKSDRIGLLFTHKNGEFGAISVTVQSCAALISKAESHISDRCSYFTG